MNTKRFIKLLALSIAAIMCTSAFTACSLGNASKYRQAFELTEQGDYESAYALFTELGDYKDAAEEAAKFRYVPIKETAEFISPEGTRIENLVISLNENNLDIGSDGTVGMNVPATGNTKFFKVVVPEK